MFRKNAKSIILTQNDTWDKKVFFLNILICLKNSSKKEIFSFSVINLNLIETEQNNNMKKITLWYFWSRITIRRSFWPSNHMQVIFSAIQFSAMQQHHFRRWSVERNRSRLTEFFSGPLIFSGYLAARERVAVPSDFANPLAKQAVEDLAGAICHWNPAAIRDVRSKSQWHLRSGLSSYPNGGPTSSSKQGTPIPSAFFFFIRFLPRAFRSCYFTTRPSFLPSFRARLFVVQPVDVEILLDHFWRWTLPC